MSFNILTYFAYEQTLYSIYSEKEIDKELEGEEKEKAEHEKTAEFFDVDVLLLSGLNEHDQQRLLRGKGCPDTGSLSNYRLGNLLLPKWLVKAYAFGDEDSLVEAVTRNFRAYMPERLTDGREERAKIAIWKIVEFDSGLSQEVYTFLKNSFIYDDVYVFLAKSFICAVRNRKKKVKPVNQVVPVDEDLSTVVNSKVFSVRRIPVEEFVERKDILDQLHNGFTDHASRKTQILCGMGGAGKTQIALKYAHMERKNYDLIVWLDATSELTLSDSCKKFMEEYGQNAEAGMQNREGFLKSVARYSDWLIIYDNADYLDENDEQKKEMQETLESYMPSGIGHVLITTRCRVKFNEGRLIEVGVFDLETAVRYLVDNTGLPECSEAEELAEKTGCLPLALSFVAAYISEQGISYHEYLDLWKEYGVELFDQEDYVKETVKASLSISLDKFKDKSASSGVANEILFTCAFDAGEYLPLDQHCEEEIRKVEEEKEELKKHPDLEQRDVDIQLYLSQTQQILTSKLKRRNVAKRLKSYSLISWDGERVYMHPMVREIIIDMHSEREQRGIAEMYRLISAISMYQKYGDMELTEKYKQQLKNRIMAIFRKRRKKCRDGDILSADNMIYSNDFFGLMGIMLNYGAHDEIREAFSLRNEALDLTFQGMEGNMNEDFYKDEVTTYVNLARHLGRSILYKSYITKEQAEKYGRPYLWTYCLCLNPIEEFENTPAFGAVDYVWEYQKGDDKETAIGRLLQKMMTDSPECRVIALPKMFRDNDATNYFIKIILDLCDNYYGYIS